MDNNENLFESMVDKVIIDARDLRYYIGLESKIDLIKSLHKNAKYGIDDRLLDQILGIERKEEE